MNKKTIFLISLLFVFLLGSSHVVSAQSFDEPYVLISVIKIDENKVDEAIDLLSDLQLSTLEKEEGCVIYDVLLGEDDPTQVFIHESYMDEKSYNLHVKSKHYQDLFAKKLSLMIKDIKTTKVFLLNFEGGYSDADI